MQFIKYNIWFVQYESTYFKKGYTFGIIASLLLYVN
jgi:hypothetical protein